MRQPSSIPILMYHRVEKVNRQSTVQGHYVSPELFKRQIRVLAAMGYETVHLSQLFIKGIHLPRKPIVITFDDGYENFLTNALPVLNSKKFVSTVFLVANQMGGTNLWDSEKGDVVEKLMSYEQVVKAKSKGTEFGSHTLDHFDLTAVSSEESWRQIHDSKIKLERMLGFPIETFCYPYGRKSPQVEQLVKKAGYRLACSTEKGINTEKTDRLALRRTNIRRDTSLPIFVLKLLRRSRSAG